MYSETIAKQSMDTLKTGLIIVLDSCAVYQYDQTAYV